jgi:hypothetical protein
MGRSIDYATPARQEWNIANIRVIQPPPVFPGPTHSFSVKTGVARCFHCGLTLRSAEEWASWPVTPCPGVPGAGACSERGQGGR